MHKDGKRKGKSRSDSEPLQPEGQLQTEGRSAPRGLSRSGTFVSLDLFWAMPFGPWPGLPLPLSPSIHPGTKVFFIISLPFDPGVVRLQAFSKIVRQYLSISCSWCKSVLFFFSICESVPFFQNSSLVFHAKLIVKLVQRMSF